jgi:hypothetical protein
MPSGSGGAGGESRRRTLPHLRQPCTRAWGSGLRRGIRGWGRGGAGLSAVVRRGGGSGGRVVLGWDARRTRDGRRGSGLGGSISASRRLVAGGRGGVGRVGPSLVLSLSLSRSRSWTGSRGRASSCSSESSSSSLASSSASIPMTGSATWMETGGQSGWIGGSCPTGDRVPAATGDRELEDQSATAAEDRGPPATETATAPATTVAAAYRSQLATPARATWATRAYRASSPGVGRGAPSVWATWAPRPR